MESGTATASFGRVQSIFDRAWSYMLHMSEERDINSLLQAIEIQLHLSPGFLTHDPIIQTKMASLSIKTMHTCSKDEFLLLVMQVLSEIKVVDLYQKTVYGDFGDNHQLYEDNHNNLLYRKEGGPLEVILQESPGNYLNRSGSPFTLDSDTDDTSSSLLDGVHPKRASSVWSGDDYDVFNLNQILEDLNTHHFTIHLNFQTIGEKLERIKLQNSRDLAFLNRLCANNDVIRDKMHDMRHEIANLLSSVEEIKSRGRDNALSQDRPTSDGRTCTTMAEDDPRMHTHGSEVVMTTQLHQSTKKNTPLVTATITTAEKRHEPKGTGANMVPWVWSIALLVAAILVHMGLQKNHENII